jgi:putative transposase
MPTICWPHAPPHWKWRAGTYFVTAGTYLRKHRFGSRPRLAYLTRELLALADEAGWQLEAWAVFSNHYHFVAKSDDDSKPLGSWLRVLHGRSACWVNRRDGMRGRKVWHNFRDTRLTIPTSYLARLSYVHRNPVRHGLVARPDLYPWCSAGWFERNASRSQVATIYGFKIDRLNVNDDYDVFGADARLAEECRRRGLV